MFEWICEHLIWDVKQRSCRIDFFFFFFKAKPIPAEIPIPPEIGRNWLERPTHPETGRNLTWGGMVVVPFWIAYRHEKFRSFWPKRNGINNIGWDPQKNLLFIYLFKFEIKFLTLELTQEYHPLLPHCVAIDSVLMGKKLIRALPRLTIRLLINKIWVHPTC